MSERCEGRYPVPQTSPPREEPFEVTYRCALVKGHDGPHGDGDRPQPVSDQLPDRAKPIDPLAAQAEALADYAGNISATRVGLVARILVALRRVQTETEEAMIRKMDLERFRVQTERQQELQPRHCAECGTPAKPAWWQEHTKACSRGKPAPFSIDEADL